MPQSSRSSFTRLLAVCLFALAGVVAVVPSALPADAQAKQARQLGDRPLRSGAHGSDVKALQRMLSSVGVKVKADGEFGPATVKAVKAFQRAANLEPSGVVGRKTVAALRKAAGGAGASSYRSSGGYDYGSTGRTHSLGDRIPLRRGMSGHDVKVLQDFLRRDGIRASIDGEFGSGTLKAVKRFEKQEGLPVDGVMDANDIDVLRGAVDAGGEDAESAPPPAPLAPGDRAKVGPDGLAIAPANAPQQVKDIIAAGNAIAKKPYVYGGGHGKWNDRGYDCSGSVSYALHGAGLLDEPLVSGDFPDWGTAGPGQWVTIYGNSGHVYMVVAGLRFDTSGQKQDGSRWHASSRPTKGYGVSHPTGL